MNDNDLIRRGDALEIARQFCVGGYEGEVEEALDALPAVALPDDVVGLVDEAGRLIGDCNLAQKVMADAGTFPTGQDIMQDCANTIRSLIAIVTAQAARIEGLQRTYDDLYSDALADAKSDAQDFDSDLWVEVRKYLTELNLDWRDYSDDGILAEEAMSHIRECMNEETRRAEAAETALAAERADKTKALDLVAETITRAVNAETALHGPIQPLTDADHANIVAHLSPDLEPTGPLPNRNSAFMALVETRNALAAMTKERDEARGIADHDKALWLQAETALAAEQAKVAKLVETYWLLRSFATHDDNCKLNKPPRFEGPCSCGLVKALADGETRAAITKAGQ